MTRFIRTFAAAALALAALALAALAPAPASAFNFGGPIVLPPPGGFQIQCGTADLAATIVDVYDYGYGWQRVTVEVTNEGSVDFQAEPLPKSGPGKVLKRVLRAPFWDGHDTAIN